jgi:hypothetical protein
MNLTTRKQKAGLIFFVSLLLCSFGFYNGFPFVFSDTGAYIRSGFLNEVLLDRPITYGLFIRHVSLAESLWLVIFVQALFVSVCLYYIFKYFTNAASKIQWLLVYVFIITVFTGASITISQIMPDVFTGILFLCLVLILFANPVRRDLVIIVFLAVLSLMMHNSHFALTGLFLLILTIAFITKRIRKKNFFIKTKNLITSWIILVFSWLLLSTIHFSFGGPFAVSQINHIFLMSRMNETGILNDYLKCECPEKKYKLCEYANEIPWDFIWNPNTPTNKMGGWLACKDEYNAILNDIFTTPKYAKKFLIKGLESGLKQFFTFTAGDVNPYLMDSSPYFNLANHYPLLKYEYLGSRQASGVLDLGMINQVQRILVILSLFLIFWFLFLKKASVAVRNIAIAILLLALCNALVCGMLSSVTIRYQSRIVWLLLLPVILHFCESGGVIKAFKPSNTNS